MTLLPVQHASLLQATVTVLQSKQETPSVRSIRVSKPEGFSFRASQAVRLTVHGSQGAVARPFSIASSPTREYLEFAARYSESDFKRAFFELRPGDEVDILGPRGHFLLEHDAPGVVVAAGIGITPLKSMLEYATDAALPTKLTLVYGSHSPEEIAFHDDIEALAHSNPRFTTMHTVTIPSPNWRGRVGRIDTALLREGSEDRANAIYYLAGPPRMVEEAYRATTSLGVPEWRIRFEVFRGYGDLRD